MRKIVVSMGKVVAVIRIVRVCMVMRVSMVMRAIDHRDSVSAFPLSPVRRDDEPPARQAGPIAVSDEPAGGVRSDIQGRDGRLDGGPMLRKGVEHRGREHVARPAAERIQVNLQRDLVPTLEPSWVP